MKKLQTNIIICGDTLKTLKTLPTESIDTIITSPPYWGLRDYGEEANVIWGGNPDCKHKWMDKSYKRRSSDGSQLCKNRWNKKSFEALRRDKRSRSWFCKKCGAWYGQLGLEPTLDLFIEHLLQITKELHRTLKPTGIMFWNHGDCYSAQRWTGSGKGQPMNKFKDGYRDINPPKNSGLDDKTLVLQNYRLILKMVYKQKWYLRNTIIWHKPNHMPSSVKDRFANSYESVFMLVKEKKYWFDLDAVRVAHKEISIKRAKYERTRKTSKGAKSELYAGLPANKVRLGIGGKNPGDVWKIPTQPFPDAHFATFPEKLIEPMIKSSCPAEICLKCGRARVRIIDNLNKGKHKGIGATSGQYIKKRQSGERKGDNTVKYAGKTIGWTKCDCKDPEYEAGIVLDPFMGSGTTALVAQNLGRNYLGIEINPEYIKIAEKRLAQKPLL